MPVELTFNAPNVTMLNDQVLAYAKAITVSWTAPNPNDSKYTSPLVERDPVADMVLRPDAIDSMNSTEEAVESVKKRRKHRRTKDLAVEDNKLDELNGANIPEPQPEPQPEPLAEPQVEEPEERVDVEPAPAPSASALDNEKLKNQVIAQLQDLFAAGKVKQIRGVLDKYGGGAKSFPEVDAGRFTDIKAAIASGEFA